MPKILIVDDELDLGELVSDILEAEEIETVVETSSIKALDLINKENFDLIILDVNMPEINGIELCSNIRNKVNCPIFFLTAKNQTLDKLVGFSVGADDYITKPFINEELVARIKAHLRKMKREEKNTNNVIKIGEIEINTESFETKKDGKIIELSTREFELLSYLMQNAGIVLSKDQIFENVWGTSFNETGTVAVHIKSLRDKLDKEEKYIKTVWGLGYKFIKVVD